MLLLTITNMKGSFKMQMRLILLRLATVMLSGCGGNKSELTFVLPPPTSVKSQTLAIPPGKEWIAPTIVIGTDVKTFRPKKRIKVTASIDSSAAEDLPTSLTVTLMDSSGKIYSSCRPQPNGREKSTYVLSGFIETPAIPGVYHLKTLVSKTLVVEDGAGVVKFFDQERELPEIVINTR